MAIVSSYMVILQEYYWGNENFLIELRRREGKIVHAHLWGADLFALEKSVEKATSFKMGLFS